MDRVKAVVTGVGPVSAIGSGRNAFWEALIAGRHGFGPITLCDVSGSPSKIGAEVRDLDLDRYVVGGRIMARRMPRTVQLALAAAVLALHDAEIDLDACNPDRLGVYAGTSIGNMDTVLSLNAQLEETGKLPAHTAFYGFNHSAACTISSFFNIRGPIHTTTSGCNSGLDALGQALRMIQSGAVDAMLVIGTDCELVTAIIASLNASNSLTTRYNDDPGRASRPFDVDRDGNVIGEGAAALLLESEAHARRRKARIYAEMVGYQVCSAGQNRQYSHDAPEVDTRPCVRALQAAMSEAGWRPSEVSAVNANGSSSVIYDRLEALALAEALGDAFPTTPVHSTKSMLGQHGAGSSALQAVATCLALRRGTVPPTINHENPDPACGPIRVVTEPLASQPARILVHSIGLGGFYYSVGAFQRPGDADELRTGVARVRWSEKKHRKFQPREEFDKPLVPWTPRSD